MSTLSLLPHNATAYDKINSKLKSGARSVLYVAGTGTGKTYVTNALLTNNWLGRKVAYVVPTVAIWDYISGVLESPSDVTMFTYSAFANPKTLKLLSENFDVVIFDEAHHMGSAVEGKNAVQFMREFSGITFGLTATPFREDGIDVNTFFDATVYGLSNFDAIRTGLMPPFEYYICSTAEARDVARQYKLVVDLPNSKELVESVTSVHKLDKLLAFYSDVESMSYGITELQELFPDHTIETLSYKSENVFRVLDNLKNKDKIIVASCDMLLEGLHVSSVDGVLLFRNIQSATVLQQIMGRVSNMGSNKNPVVMDFTESAFKLFNKIMSADYKSQKIHSGIARASRAVKPMLKIPVQSITAYNIMSMLAALQGDPVYILGHDFSNLRSACRYYNITLNKLLKVMSGCTSLDEAFTKFLSDKYHVGKKQYNTLAAACKDFDIPVTSLRSAANRLGIPVTVILEDFSEFPFTVDITNFSNPRDVSEFTKQTIVNVLCQRYTAGSYSDIIINTPKTNDKRYKIFNRYYATLSDFCKSLRLKISDVRELANDQDIPVECAAEEICRRSRIVIMDHVFVSQQAIGSQLNIRVLMQKYYQPGDSLEDTIIKCLDPNGLNRQPIYYNERYFNNLAELCKVNDISFLDVLITYHNTGTSIPVAIESVMEGNVIENWQFDGKSYKSLPIFLQSLGINDYRFNKYVLEHDCTLRDAVAAFLQ